MRLLTIALALAVCWATGARAQQAVVTTPGAAYSGDASGTITSTNTFQTIWSAIKTGSFRHGCLIVNTSTDEQWVYFGSDSDTPTKAKSIPLEPAPGTARLGGWTSCATAGGGILQDHVWITGTSTDTFVAKQQ